MFIAVSTTRLFKVLHIEHKSNTRQCKNSFNMPVKSYNLKGKESKIEDRQNRRIKVTIHSETLTLKFDLIKGRKVFSCVLKELKTTDN